MFTYSTWHSKSKKLKIIVIHFEHKVISRSPGCVSMEFNATLSIQDEITVRPLRQREACTVPLHLLSVLGMKSVGLAHSLRCCQHNKGVTFSQRWPSTCHPNDSDIALDTVSRKEAGEKRSCHCF